MKALVEKIELILFCKDCQKSDKLEKPKYIEPKPVKRISRINPNSNSIEKMEDQLLDHNQIESNMKEELKPINTSDFESTENVQVGVCVNNDNSSENIIESKSNVNPVHIDPIKCKELISVNSIQSIREGQSRIHTMKSSKLTLMMENIFEPQRIGMAKKMATEAKLKHDQIEMERHKRLKEIIKKGEERRRIYKESGRPEQLRNRELQGKKY